MDTHPLPSAERDALLALWAVPGVGSIGLGGMRRWAAGRWADLLDTPARDWVDALPGERPGPGTARAAGSLRAVADEVRERAARGRMMCSTGRTPGTPSVWPRCATLPALLFMRGTVSRPRRRLAMVGTRHPEQGFLRTAREFAAAVAGGGAAVVSGAAAGVDRACHLGALDVGGETWAFLGSALDEVDAAQARLVPASSMAAAPSSASCRRGSGRASRRSPGETDSSPEHRMRSWCCGRRRRGAMHTVAAARVQGRPILACPGELWAPLPAAATSSWPGVWPGCAWGRMTHSGRSGSMGGHPRRARRRRGRCPGCPAPRRASTRSSGASRARSRSWKRPRGSIRGGAVSALCELELLGLVTQVPGRRYQRV